MQVATPPNAIVYSASGMTTRDMLGPGLVLNILCIAVNVLAVNTYGMAMFDLNNFPDWANSTAQC